MSYEVPHPSPSPIDISKILTPWRTPTQREVANKDSMAPAIWLRTCYTADSYARHEALLKGCNDMDMAVGGENRLLNDHTRYNYGDDWQRVFEVLPELLQPNDRSWAAYEKQQHNAIAALRAYAEGGVARADQRLVKNLTGVAQGTPDLGFRGADLELEVAKALRSNVHKACVVAWVVLEDEEALKSGQVNLLFVDSLGRVVRSRRIGAGAASQMGGFWADGCWDEIGEWYEGDLGPEYQLGGACGGLLLESMRDL
ncbi:MAG: hypothetical protein Q9200_002318 [Gallowayella weberi]